MSGDEGEGSERLGPAGSAGFRAITERRAALSKDFARPSVPFSNIRDMNPPMRNEPTGNRTRTHWGT